ncbi:MAG: RtcB family protein [Candidatus Hodarchaeota archaeon]
MFEVTELTETIDVKKITPYEWEVPKRGEMLVPGKIFGDKAIIDHLLEDVRLGKEWNALKQIVNVAHLPGILKASLAMPDVHPGYGFPIGGVGAFDLDEGVISVAGVGYDINCGVRMLKTPLTRQEVEGKKQELGAALFRNIPAGLGSEGDVRLTMREIDEVLRRGARFVVEERGYGTEDDLEHTEEKGCVPGAKPENVSHRAKQRQVKQIGTLGSGNHYLEVQYINEIFDEEVAETYGLFKDQIVLSIHCGSRGLGHQIGTDYLKILDAASKKYKIPIRERELVCAPFNSEEGQQYFSAVNCGINAAFCNRQAITYLTRKTLVSVMGIAEDDVKTFYGVGHNTAKLETHSVNGKPKQILVMRKGATRGFGPGREEIPLEYRDVGQPVIVGGTMGTSSYVLKGTEKGMRDTWGSTNHGAGRVMSRKQAKKRYWGATVIKELGARGILVKDHSKAGVAEEAPGAYKDVNHVVNVMHSSGISAKVVQVKPLIVIKG